MSVLNDYWNQGVGGSLLRYMIEWAKESGVIKKINLKVLGSNESAIRLYEKQGFQMEGRIVRDLKLKSGFQNTFQMGLLIN